MTVSFEEIMVVGHLNPDTDASVAAVAYADFLNAVGRYEFPAVGVVAGELTPQAKYAFERAGVPIPRMIDSVEPCVGHIATKELHSITERHRIGEALGMVLRHGVSMLPIVNEQKELLGVFSNRDDVLPLLTAPSTDLLLGYLLTLEDLFEVPHMQLRTPAVDGPSILGELRVAMSGDSSWQELCLPEDVLLCANVEVLKSIPTERWPCCTIVAGPQPTENDGLLQQLIAQQRVLLDYDHSVVDLLRHLPQQVRVGKLQLSRGRCLGSSDRLQDVSDLIRTSKCALPVVDEEGKLAGVVSRQDLETQCRCQLVLVDHFETRQAVRGVEYGRILEIVDHHRVGDIQTSDPIRVECRPVGSSASIVAMSYREASLPIPPSLALLMLSGILSDTLALNGPTATAKDREIAELLAEIAGVDLAEYGLEILRAGDDLMSADPESIWNRDQKAFGIRNHTFTVAQLETVCLDSIDDARFESFQQQIAKDRDQHDHLLSLLVVTDVLRGDSWIAASESSRAAGVLQRAFGRQQPRAGWTLANGIVSRKKQIVPQVMNELAKLRLDP